MALGRVFLIRLLEQATDLLTLKIKVARTSTNLKIRLINVSNIMFGIITQGIYIYIASYYICLLDSSSMQ